jgi:hypothetical protein
MNTIQKATFAASALAITLVGAALVTAPIAFARPLPVVAHSGCAPAALQFAQSGQAGCAGMTGMRG